MFYKKVELLGDNGVQIIIPTEHPEKKTDVGNGVTEWSDNNIREELVIKLNEAKNIKFRFDGKYTYSYTMNWSQRQAFKEVVERFKTL